MPPPFFHTPDWHESIAPVLSRPTRPLGEQEAPAVAVFSSCKYSPV